MDPKPRPNRATYLDVLRQMTPQQRLKKAFELSDFTKRIFKQGLRDRYPRLSEEALQKLYLERLAKCHNRNY